MLDPGSKDLNSNKDVLAAKALVVLDTKVPARFIKVNFYLVTLRKGTTLSSCLSVVSVDHLGSTSIANQEPTEEMEMIAASECPSLPAQHG